MVRRVFVEGHEVVGREGLFEFWWDMGVENELKGPGERGEAGQVIFIVGVRLVEGKGAEGVREISEGSGGSGFVDSF